MASSGEELKSLLFDVGTKLDKPPVSVKELLELLDRVDICLSRVEQSPSKEIQNVLAPTLKALVGDELLKHEDVDVKVSVASCISEITRITAPEVPYEDDKMKEIFQLFVWSFERLADMSSQSYSKRTSILETIAKVRSSVVMLDLECDGLILQMFRHFIKTIRDYHPPNIFSCMESIMTRVIEESEEIPLDLLFCILDTVKNENKEVLPRAQTLMKKVIETCSDKLKPYIEIAMRANGVSLADYDEVVSLICNEASAEKVVQSEHTDAFVQVDDSKPAICAADAIMTAEETQATVVNSIELPPGGCSELVNSNGNAPVEADTLSDIKDGDSNAGKVDGESITEPKTEKIMKKRGRKAKGKKKASETKLAGKSNSSVNQLEKLPDSHKSCSKDKSPSPKTSRNEADVHSSPKPLEAHDGASEEVCGESDGKLNGSPKGKTVISSSENHMLLDEKTTIYAGGSKEETTADTSIWKTNVSVADATVDTNVPVDKSMKNAATTVTSDDSREVAAPIVDETIEKIEPSAGKSLELKGVPSEDCKLEDGPKTEEGTKKRVRGKGKATLQKLAAQAAVEDNNKEATTSPKPSLKAVNEEEKMKETPKTSNKRKHTEPNSNESKSYGEKLVGSMIKVWWPADRKFYKGVIESFDSAKNKHRVLYADGEVENLFLKKQRWEVINPDDDSDADEETHLETPAAEKQHEVTEANEGTSKKRLGRPPSIKSKSASSKPGCKPKSDGKSRDDSKEAKEQTDNSKEEEISKVKSGKKLGRSKADASKSTGRVAADEPSPNAAEKSKTDESDKSTRAEDSKSSGKLKGGDSKTTMKGKFKSNTPLDDDSSNVKQKDTEGKGTKPFTATPAIKSSGKSKIKETSGTSAKEDTRKTISDGENDSISLKAAPKSDAKAPAKAEVECSGADGEEAPEEQTATLAKATGRSKRKASLSEKGNKSEAKPKGKKGRKH